MTGRAARNAPAQWPKVGPIPGIGIVIWDRGKRNVAVNQVDGFIRRLSGPKVNEGLVDVVVAIDICHDGENGGLRVRDQLGELRFGPRRGIAAASKSGIVGINVART